MAPDGDEDELGKLVPQDPRGGERELDRQDPRRRERELNEVRRSFTDVSRRLGTLGQRQRFATVHPVAAKPGGAGGDEAGQLPIAVATFPELPTVEVKSKRRPRVLLAALALGLIFTAGLLLGRTLDRGRPATTSASPTPSTIIKQVTKTLTPPSCLAAVEHADQSIDFLVRRIRDQRFLDTLDSFVKDSRACHRAGSTAAGAG